MKHYVCTIESNSSFPCVYDVTTSSALKCAEMYGRCEGGEVVTVETKHGRVVSMACWTMENGGHYYRAFVPRD